MTSRLRRFFRRKKARDLEGLVRRLLFYRDETIVLEALREAVSYAPKGDDLGVQALSEAVRRRCEGRCITFYTPSPHRLRSFGELEDADSRLLDLAQTGRLLDDPAATQELIATALPLSKDGLRSLLRCIFLTAGVEAGYDFQLLYNQVSSSTKLRHARGQ